MIMRIEFYDWIQHAGVRDLVADLVRRARRDKRNGLTSTMTPTEYRAFKLWVTGAFHRDTIAAGWWLDEDQPVVRDGTGAWWTLNHDQQTLDRLRIKQNLSAGVSYQHTA